MDSTDGLVSDGGISQRVMILKQSRLYLTRVLKLQRKLLFSKGNVIYVSLIFRLFHHQKMMQ